MPLLLRSTLTLILLSLTSLATAELDYTPNQAKTAIEVIEELSTKHYRKQPLDDELSSKLLHELIDNLDPTKSYLLQEDITEFQQWETRLDDMFREGDLSAGFFIYNRYNQRTMARLQENISLLESDFQFDLTKDEYLPVEVDNNQWPATNTDADDEWRKRIKEAYLRLMLNDKEPEAARELLIKRYTNLHKQLGQRDSEDIFQLIMNSLASLYDPHTAYMSPRSMENFRIAMSLSLTGIGAVLQLEDEHTKIVRVVPGGPADKQGILKAGDKVIAVGQGDEEKVDVIGWRLDDVVDLIRGPKDSIVRLELIQAQGESVGSSRDISIVRDKIQLEEQSAQAEVIHVQTDAGKYSLGVIEIPAFYLDVDAYYNRDPDFKSTTKDVLQLLQDLEKQNVDGIILDLRNNGGGFLQEATTLTDLFIDPGPIVQVQHSDQLISRNYRSRADAYYRGPLVVLINRLSASASEIFAGAIQDYGRGLVVGGQSFGKGTVQVQLPVREGQLKLTESKFYRVSGNSTQHLGVVPDIQLPSFYDIDKVGESSEDNALPWDRIPAAPHRRYNLTRVPMQTLQERHEYRLKMDPDLVHLHDKLALIKERQKVKQLSLNEIKRRGEAKEYDTVLLSLENKRRLAKELPLYPSIEEWRAVEEPEEEGDDDRPLAEKDPILYEVGNIMSDYMSLAKSPVQQAKQP
ncbi:MAG: carboxy terminal-processing peptidase [Porticoccus sp.]|nr:carboxy terminal-processing peptidase [Porticoccus sp.]MBQ0806725.1 carboxy terminal-processing peptidase [Porticoccus sp.]